MARLIRITQRTFSSRASSSPSIIALTDGLSGCGGNPIPRSRNAISMFRVQTRSYATEAWPKSPFEANILRILRNEIEYQLEYAPPELPLTKFNSFTVQDRMGQQWITLRRKFGDNEDIKVEATMFDGYQQVPRLGDDSSGVNVHLHISLLVDISKGEAGNQLEFVCSAWPERLEIDKIYILRRDRIMAMPYMGPDFRNMNGKVQETFREYLEARGINNDLSVFLHGYMKNKDRIELLQWLESVKSFVEK